MKPTINKAAVRLEAALDEFAKVDTSSLHNTTYTNMVITSGILLRSALAHMRQYGDRKGYDIMDTFDTVQKAVNSLDAVTNEVSGRPYMKDDWKARSRVMDSISRLYTAGADFNYAIHEAGYRLD